MKKILTVELTEDGLISSTTTGLTYIEVLGIAEHIRVATIDSRDRVNKEKGIKKAKPSKKKKK